MAYWSSYLGGGIYKAPVTGGSVMLVTAASQPSSIAADSTDIFWDDVGTKSIRRVSIAGGMDSTVEDYGASPPVALELDATHIYVTSGHNGANFPSLWRRPKPGGSGSLEELVPVVSSPRVLALDADSVYTGSFRIDKATKRVQSILESGLGSAMRADTSHIYYVASSYIYRVDKCGYMKTVFNVSPTGKTILGVLIDDSQVYWFEDDAVRKLPK
jgi:hypothetical protein